MGSELWFGVALNPGGKTVKWNESSVDRIYFLVLLWWYIHANQLRQAGRFLRAVDKPRSNEKYPRAKDAVKELKKSLRSVVVGADEEPTEDEIQARVTARLTTMLDRVCRLTPAATARDEDEESDDAGGVSAPEPAADENSSEDNS